MKNQRNANDNHYRVNSITDGYQYIDKNPLYMHTTYQLTNKSGFVFVLFSKSNFIFSCQFNNISFIPSQIRRYHFRLYILSSIQNNVQLFIYLGYIIITFFFQHLYYENGVVVFANHMPFHRQYRQSHYCQMHEMQIHF